MNYRNQSRLSGQSGAAIFKRSIAILVCAALICACSSPEQRVDEYYESGEEYFENDDYSRANLQYRNALKINEDHAPSLIRLSEIAEARQNFRAMFGILQRIVRLQPENVEARTKLSQLHLINGDEAAALELIDEALALNENHPAPWL